MNILHATTDPDLLTRLREMLDSSACADIAVGYLFMSGSRLWPTAWRGWIRFASS